MFKRKEIKSMSERDMMTHQLHRVSLWFSESGKSMEIHYMDKNHIKNSIKKYSESPPDHPKAKLLHVLKNELLYRELKNKELTIKTIENDKKDS